jgi:molybdate-binding protein
MFGDKRLEMPETNEGCLDLLESFGFNIVNDLAHNARRLIELNNEVYDKLHSREFCAAQHKRDIIETLDWISAELTGNIKK